MRTTASRHKAKPANAGIARRPRRIQSLWRGSTRASPKLVSSVIIDAEISRLTLRSYQGAEEVAPSVAQPMELDEILECAAHPAPVLDWRALALDDETALTPSRW